MKHLKPTKNCIVLMLLIAYNINTHAQEVSNLVNAKVVNSKADTVPLKAYQPAPSTIQNSLRNDIEDTVFENRLVELALAQPNYEQTLYQQKIFEYQLKKQRNAWLNLLTISTTYNDQSFAKPSTANGAPAYIYPKFYLGVTIPLGLIFLNGADVKITKQSELMAQSQQQELAKSIKASVLTTYKQYKANEKLLIIQNQAIDDEQANFLNIEEKFKGGTATLEIYNEASRRYNDEIVKGINLQLQQDLVKVELERLIGRRLEDVLK